MAKKLMKQMKKKKETGENAGGFTLNGKCLVSG